MGRFEKFKCDICGKELEVGDTIFMDYDTGYLQLPMHSHVFCSKECASKNGRSEAQETTLEISPDLFHSKIDKLVEYAKILGFEEPKDCTTDIPSELAHKYCNTVLIFKLPLSKGDTLCKKR